MGLRVVAGSVLVSLACIARGAVAQSPLDELKADVASKAFQKYAAETAGSYRMRTAGPEERPLKLEPKSLLRWSNQLTGKQTFGEVFLWTDRGRPQAVLSLYRFTNNANELKEQHEFCLLSSDRLASTRNGDDSWSPAQSEIEWQSAGEAPVPAPSPARRLLDMRRIASALSAQKTTRENVTRELRLLPQPVYRYEGNHPDIVDAGLFAFVEETDPEVFVMIEARKTPTSSEWKLGFARMNSIDLKVKRGDQVVWEAAVLPYRDVFDRPDRPYTAFRFPNPPPLSLPADSAAGDKGSSQ